MAQKFAQTSYEAPPGSTEIFLVRHGASQAFDPDGPPFELVDGHGNPPLAPEGRDQAERVGERLATESFDAIYVTSLLRTHETAAPLAARVGMTPLVEPDLREVFLGDWEGGVFRQKAAENHPAAVKMRETGEWGHIPGAETTAEFSGRCIAGLERIHANHPDQRIVVVCHGGVIAALCSHAVGANGFALGGADNCSIHHLILTVEEGWKLRCFNDTSHLGGFTSEAQGMT